MRFSSIATLALIVCCSLFVSSSFAKEVGRQHCSIRSSPSPCGEGQYCLAAKPHSYCVKKRDGGKVCQNDETCVSNICFTAKETEPHAGKRVCAAASLSGFADNARCTSSTQCTSGFCTQGYCRKRVGAGRKCSKEEACAESDDGAHCLNKPATFNVYNSAGEEQTKNLSAGRCSYVTNLGEGMKCASNANCFADKFECSEETKTCTAIDIVPPSDLPYQSACARNEECASNSCNEGRCGCLLFGSDCNATTEYCADFTADCRPKLPYGAKCRFSEMCQDGQCIIEFSGYGRRDTKQFCGCGSDAACPGTLTCDAYQTCVP